MEGPKPVQSPADKKTYKYLKLSNGMSVLLIHDPAVAISAGTEVGLEKHWPGQSTSFDIGHGQHKHETNAEGNNQVELSQKLICHMHTA